MGGGSSCGTTGVFDLRFVSTTYPCEGNFGGSFSAGMGDAGGVLSSGGFFFGDCAVTSASMTCPAHVTVACGPSSGTGGQPGIESGATLDVDVGGDASYSVTGTLTVDDKSGGSCKYAASGSFDPNATGI